jgi:hypothetical protein
MLPSIGRSSAPSRNPGRGRIQTITNHRLIAPLRRAHLGLWALWLAGSGCTSLREIPRGEYGARTERRDVRLVTREGLKYEFDYMRVEGDTLFGYRHREVEGPVEEFGSLHVALDDVSQLEARRVDWLRTGLIGATAASGVVVAGVIRNRKDKGPEDSGGGKVPVP